jgi:hypothetical protein
MAYQFSATPLYVEEGQSIQFRYEAPPSYSEVTNVTIDIGELTITWVIETKLEDFAPDPFFLQNIDEAESDVMYTYAQTAFPDDGVAYTGLTPGEPDPLRSGEEVITITGLDPGTEAPLSVTSNVLDPNDYAYRVNQYLTATSSYGAWGPWTRAINQTISNLDRIQVRLRASSAPSDTKNVNVVVGTGSAEWEITTGAIPINTPNPAPNFGSLNNQELNALVYSDRPQILGLTTQALMTVDNSAEIAVSNFNTTFTNADGFEVLSNIIGTWGNNKTVQNGQYVQLRGTSSGSEFSPKNFSVTIGDGNGISGWIVTTGAGLDENPNSFVFQNLVEQIPGNVNYRSTVQSGSASSGKALVAGLTPGIFVPVSLRSGDTTSTANPRISVNGGSSGIISNIQVQNGDIIELVLDGSNDISNPLLPGQGSTKMGINVGDRFVPTWSITNWTGPDTSPSFTPINQVLNRTPGGASVIGPIGLTNFNLPITISASSLVAYNEFNFATGENIGNVLFSLNGDTPAPGPRTLSPDPGNNPVFVTIIYQQPGNANLDPVVGLSHYGVADISFGTAAPFTLRSVNYAVKPVPPSYLGVWYSEKNAFFAEEAWEAVSNSDPANAKSFYRQPKHDGYAIGTVLPVPRETIADDGNFGYGDIDIRFPGFLECDGTSVAAAEYPWLWESIGNTYGGNATYISASKTYSGNFNLPDYRNVRMVGPGRVDFNKGSSPSVPVTSAGGSAELPGSTGGWWYFDDVDVSAAPDPLEQVIAPAGQTSGTESSFYTLGTPRTFGTELVTTEVDFTVTGNVNANVGPVTSVSVRPPQHEHQFITGQPEDPDGDPVIPWNIYAYLRTAASGSQSWNGQNDSKDDAVDDGYWEDANFWNYADADREFSRAGRGSLEDVLPGSGSTTVAFGNYWGTPAGDLQSEANSDGKGGSFSPDRFSAIGAFTQDAGVIDTTEGRARIKNYLSIYTGTLTHAHLLGTDPVLDPQNDYTYGNVNGDAVAYRSGLATFNSTFDLQFSQSDVQIELNPATFSWNNSTKPIPQAKMNPQRKVPILAPFHKIKYIIKAY